MILPKKWVWKFVAQKILQNIWAISEIQQISRAEKKNRPKVGNRFVLKDCSNVEQPCFWIVLYIIKYSERNWNLTRCMFDRCVLRTAVVCGKQVCKVKSKILRIGCRMRKHPCLCCWWKQNHAEQRLPNGLFASLFDDSDSGGGGGDNCCFFRFYFYSNNFPYIVFAPTFPLPKCTVCECEWVGFESRVQWNYRVTIDVTRALHSNSSMHSLACQQTLCVCARTHHLEFCRLSELTTVVSIACYVCHT